VHRHDRGTLGERRLDRVGSTFSVSGRMSTKTGRAPARTKAFAVDT